MSVEIKTTVDKSMLAEISRLRKMTVGQLRDEWLRLYGEPTSSRNRDYLWRRLSWRTQELAQGGLSDRATQRIGELAPAGFERAVTPRDFTPPTQMSAAAVRIPPPRPVRDLRMPPVGSVITKDYKGRQLHVVVREDSFEFEGRSFESLSTLAKFITGRPTQINGRLFFALTGRKRRS